MPIRRENKEIMITGIHHFSIIVSSEKSIDFYISLGFREERRITRTYDTVVLLNGYGIGLEVFLDPKHPGKGNPEPLGLRSLSLQVDRLEETARELGLEIIEVHTDWNGKRYAVVKDPDGNAVQLCE